MASITVNRSILDTYAVHEFAGCYGITRQQALGHLMGLWLWAVERKDNTLDFGEGSCDMAFVCAIMGIERDAKDDDEDDSEMLHRMEVLHTRVLMALEASGIVREIGNDPAHREIVFPDGVRIVPPQDEDA